MLTLFIVPSNAKNANVRKTIRCFKPFIKDMVKCKGWKEINHYAKKTAWYAVFYDNEYIDLGVQQALQVFFKNPKYDILNMYKLTNGVALDSRIFNSAIYLRGTFIPVARHVSFGVILDGWVMEHS